MRTTHNDNKAMDNFLKRRWPQISKSCGNDRLIRPDSRPHSRMYKPSKTIIPAKRLDRGQSPSFTKSSIVHLTGKQTNKQTGEACLVMTARASSLAGSRVSLLLTRSMPTIRPIPLKRKKKRCDEILTGETSVRKRW